MTYEFDPFTVEALGTVFTVKPNFGFAEAGAVTLARVELPRDAEYRDIPFTVNGVQYDGHAYIEYRDDWRGTYLDMRFHRAPSNFNSRLTDAADTVVRAALAPAVERMRTPNGNDVVAHLAENAAKKVEYAINGALRDAQMEGWRKSGETGARWPGIRDKYEPAIKAAVLEAVDAWKEANR